MPLQVLNLDKVLFIAFLIWSALSGYLEGTTNVLIFIDIHSANELQTLTGYI